MLNFEALNFKNAQSQKQISGSTLNLHLKLEIGVFQCYEFLGYEFLGYEGPHIYERYHTHNS